MIQPPRQPSHKKSLRQKKLKKKRKYDEYYKTFSTPHVIQTSTQHIKSQLVCGKEGSYRNMPSQVEANHVTGVSILAISVAKHRGREIISDTIKSQVS